MVQLKGKGRFRLYASARFDPSLAPLLLCSEADAKIYFQSRRVLAFREDYRLREAVCTPIHN